MEERKGEDILLLDIQEISDFADYFIIGSGTSDRMIDSLAEAVREMVKQKFDLLSKVEGESRGGWVVIDLGDIVVHLFSPDQRDYYQLEQLWDKGKVLLSLQ